MLFLSEVLIAPDPAPLADLLFEVDELLLRNDELRERFSDGRDLISSML
mgnify:CR=1 FL=1